MKPTEYFVSWPNKLHEQTEQTRLGLVLYNRVKTGFMVHNKMTFVKGNCWPIFEELVSRKRIDILEKTTVISSNGRECSLKDFIQHLKLVNLLQ